MSNSSAIIAGKRAFALLKAIESNRLESIEMSTMDEVIHEISEIKYLVDGDAYYEKLVSGYIQKLLIVAASQNSRMYANAGHIAFALDAGVCISTFAGVAGSHDWRIDAGEDSDGTSADVLRFLLAEGLQVADVGVRGGHLIHHPNDLVATLFESGLKECVFSDEFSKSFYQNLMMSLAPRYAYSNTSQFVEFMSHERDTLANFAKGIMHDDSKHQDYAADLGWFITSFCRFELVEVLSCIRESDFGTYIALMTRKMVPESLSRLFHAKTKISFNRACRNQDFAKLVGSIYIKALTDDNSRSYEEISGFVDYCGSTGVRIEDLMAPFHYARLQFASRELNRMYGLDSYNSREYRTNSNRNYLALDVAIRVGREPELIKNVKFKDVVFVAFMKSYEYCMPYEFWQDGLPVSILEVATWTSGNTDEFDEVVAHSFSTDRGRNEYKDLSFEKLTELTGSFDGIKDSDLRAIKWSDRRIRVKLAANGLNI